MDLTTLFRLSYGMYIISAKNGERFNGQTANTVFQISSEPPTVAVSINKQNLTHEFIQAGQSFTVSILAKDAPLDLIGRFGFKSGRDLDKFAGLEYKLSPAGIPYLTKNTLAYLEARVIQATDVKTHTMFIGELTDAALISEGEPMTYAYYHEIKRGTTPKTAPTFNPAPAKPAPAADKYECTICGYVYDPSQGDLENNIAPGTAFEDLPADWVCPVCGASKDEFQKV